MKQEPKIIVLPKNEESRGYLTYIEKDLHIPFEIDEVSLVYNIPESVQSQEEKANCKDEFLICLSGSAEVHIGHKNEEQVFFLNKAYKGLFIPAGCSKKISNFSSNAMVLKLISKAT